MKIHQKKPKAMNYKFTLTLLLILISPLILRGQSYSEMRTFQKSFRVNKEMTLEVSNKYGTLHLTTWDKDSVSVRAEIEAFASTQTKLGKMFEGININFSESSYQIIAQTDFTQSISMLFESFKGMTKKLIPYDSRIQINYFISLPENINLKIDNKYGDVYMENNSADISISLSNGSFKANVLNKASEIKLAFCDATINKIASGTIDASFSEVIIRDSENLSISSISSRLDLKQAGKVNTESRRDKYFIGTITSIEGDSYFTDFKIEELLEELDLITKYGSIYTDVIDKSIQRIAINSGYTDIGLSFDPGVSYNLDIRHINAFLTTPGKNAQLEKKSINEDKKEYITFGTIGKNPGNIKVKIDANRGNVFIK
jgi:hypothetical protein